MCVASGRPSARRWVGNAPKACPTTGGACGQAGRLSSALYTKSYEIHKDILNDRPSFHANNKNTGNLSDATSSPNQSNFLVTKKFRFYPLNPNPFNPKTHIKFDLPKAVMVKIKVYDVAGQFIGYVFNEHKNPGSHTAIWNASNLASGMYFIRLEAGSFIATRKCLLLK